jgi:oligoendopeptidase F
LRTRAFIFNTLLLDKATDDRLRGYTNWLASRNLSNEASDESVQALVDAVVARYDIPHRYYALKARLLGVDKLKDYDRMAPVGEGRKISSWNEARELIVASYHDFSPVTGEIVDGFFSKSWIDAPVRPNKAPGAFCATTIPGVHPYVLMNYTGERRSVLTLAHELGHGLHGVLAQEQGLFNADTTLTLAETASVFGEALTFRRLLEGEDDPRERLALLVGRLDDTVATVFRQVALSQFENAVHSARRERGELSLDDFARMWVDTQAAVLGDAVEVTDGYRAWWSYITHFVRTPGYVYAYAFGYLFSLAIFRRYVQEGDAMVAPYMKLLAAGGSDTPENLASIVGLDVTDPEFWAGGLAAVDEVLAEAESLAADA